MNNQTRNLIVYITQLTLLCGLVLFLVNIFASTAIRGHLHHARLQSISTLLPSATSFSSLDKTKTIEASSVIIGVDASKKKVGYVISSEGHGYGGPIRMLVGISGSKITGIQILSLTETAGMGSLVIETKPMTGRVFTFQGQFANKSIFDQFNTHEDIIALTGATITSQGVGTGIQEAVKIYRRLENVQYED
jgi:electron transport complex protein RnfG